MSTNASDASGVPHGSARWSDGERVIAERRNPDGGAPIPVKMWLPLFMSWDKDDPHKVVASVGPIPAARIRAMEAGNDEVVYAFRVHILESHPALVAFEAEPMNDPIVSVTLALPVQFVLPGDTPRIVQVYEATPAMLRRTSDEWDEWGSWITDGSVFDVTRRLGAELATWVM